MKSHTSVFRGHTWRVFLCSSGLLLSLLFAAIGATQEPDDLQAMQGEWTLTQIQMRGRNVIPYRKSGETLAKLETFTIKDKTIFVNGEREYTLVLDQMKKPRQLDASIVKTKTTALGIYKIDGDTLIICWADKERPTDFKTEVDKPDMRLLTLKRIQKK